MTSLGTTLARAREARGLTVEEVAQRTRVPLASLVALEEGDVASLPAPVYVRGFVRAFALEVGVDPAALLAELARAETETAALAEPMASPLFGAPGGRPDPLGAERYALLFADARADRPSLTSSHVVLMLLAFGMLLAGWLMVGTKGLAPAQAEAPEGPPAIQEQVDAVTSITSDAR